MVHCIPSHRLRELGKFVAPLLVLVHFFDDEELIVVLACVGFTYRSELASLNPTNGNLM